VQRVREHLAGGERERLLTPLGGTDRRDPLLHLGQSRAKDTRIVRADEVEVRESDKEGIGRGLCMLQKFTDRRERLLSPRGSGMHDAACGRPRGGRVGRQQPPLLQLGQQVVDRGEADVGPLADAALLDDALQVVAVTRLLDDESEDRELGGGQSLVAILALE
jgi:hypothetical protein